MEITEKNVEKIDPESLWWLMVVHEWDPIFYMRDHIQGGECLSLRKKYVSQTALDVGCGPGPCWPFLKGMRIIGLDIKIGPSIKNRAKQYGVELVIADAQHLPIKKKEIALLTCEEVLEHLHDPFLALREISRVMKDDGVLLVDTPVLLDKVRDRAIAPFVILLEKIVEKIRGQGEKKGSKEDGGGRLRTVETAAVVISRIPSEYLRLLALRFIWIFWTVRAALEEHVGTYGWAWTTILKKAGFEIEKVQGCAIFYLPALMMKNLAPLNRFEEKIRAKYPFHALGQIMCIRARKETTPAIA